jgi:hypothetical protein
MRDGCRMNRGQRGMNRGLHNLTTLSTGRGFCSWSCSVSLRLLATAISVEPLGDTHQLLTEVSSQLRTVMTQSAGSHTRADC